MAGFAVAIGRKGERLNRQATNGDTVAEKDHGWLLCVSSFEEQSKKSNLR